MCSPIICTPVAPYNFTMLLPRIVYSHFGAGFIEIVIELLAVSCCEGEAQYSRRCINFRRSVHCGVLVFGEGMEITLLYIISYYE